MNDLAMIIKTLLFIDFALKYAQTKATNPHHVLFLVMIAMFFNVIIYIYEDKKFKRVTLAMLIILSIYCSIKVSPYFLLFVPINMYEFIFTYTTRLLFYVFALAIALMFAKQRDIIDYFMLASILLVTYYSAIKVYERLCRFENECDRLREENHILTSRVKSMDRYDNQIVYTSQLEERNSISQQIHDKVGHTIAGSLMQLEAAKLMVSKDSDKAEKILENVIAILRGGLEEIRITLRAIKPKQDQMGINRLKLIIKRFEIGSLKIYFSCNGDSEKVTVSIWNIIEQNVKEALTNVSKYSHGTEVDISIEVLNKLIKVQVKDNGEGCEIVKKGLGILGMEERMNKVNGQLLVNGTDGFSIIMLFPL